MEITVDVESDWGGRSDTLHGINEGIPFILDELRFQNIHGLFFLSTEYLERYADTARRISNCGHKIASHGHHHFKWKKSERRLANIDKTRSITQLMDKLRLDSTFYYRAPKFSFDDGGVYATRHNHVGLLRILWGLDHPKPDSILYLHPFDIIKPKTQAPNLFCKLWYGRPDAARKKFIQLLNLSV